MSEHSPQLCPHCREPLPSGVSEGLFSLCPRCLLATGTAMSTGTVEPRPFTPPPPEELGRYFPQLEILELLGRGGMGAVYKARQRELDRVIAVKILPPDIGSDPAFAQRFTREAQALAKLNHPHIVTLYDFGQVDGLFYFFMEYVDGVNLRQLLNGQRMNAKEALAIVPQVCDALQYAHDRGIVHRDIKPENLLLNREGLVKIADFGVACIVTGDRAELPGSHAAGGMTESGKVVGTPSYMAPEQMHSPQEVDHRADIYSLGVVFYQMLTGELPGRDLLRPSRRVQIDVRLDEVVLRALAQNPEQRYQQASLFKTQLETLAQPRTDLRHDAGRPGGFWRWAARSRWFLLLLVTALPLLIALALSRSEAIRSGVNAAPSSVGAGQATGPILPGLLATFQTEGGKAAVEQMLATGWAARPLFAEDSPLRISDTDLMRRSPAEQAKVKEEVLSLTETLRRLVVVLREEARQAVSVYDDDRASRCAETLKAFGRALAAPERLAGLRALGLSMEQIGSAMEEEAKAKEADPSAFAFEEVKEVRLECPVTGHPGALMFHTGKVYSPAEVAEKAPGFRADASASLHGLVRGLVGWDMVAIPIRESAWADFPAHYVHSSLNRTELGSPIVIPGIDERPLTYVFRTRHDARGILQITALEKEAVRLHYKLARKVEPSHVPKVTPPEALFSRHVEQPRLQFRLVAGQEATEVEEVPARNEGEPPYRLEKEVFLTEGDIRRVRMASGDSGNFLEIDLTEEGAVRFSDPTIRHSGRRLAIVFDGEVISAPFLREPIFSGSLAISGNFTDEALRDLFNALKPPHQPEPVEEPPALRALNWQEWETAGRTTRWLPDGSPAPSLPSQVGQPTVHDHTESAVEAQAAFLMLWFSSPQVDAQSFERVVLLEADGETPLRGPSGTVSFGASAADLKQGREGWIDIAVCAGSRASLPGRVIISLRYGMGLWSVFQTVPVVGEPSRRFFHYEVGPLIEAYAEDGGKAYTILKLRTDAIEEAGAEQLELFATLKDGRRVKISKHTTKWPQEEKGTWEKEFRCEAAVGEIAFIEGRTRPTREVRIEAILKDINSAP